jgi:hypothetical protein
LWHNPVDILARIFDVAGFAVDAILGIDLQTRVVAALIKQDFVDTGRAETLLGGVILSQIDRYWDRCILELQMARLIFLVIGTRKKD